MRMQYWTGWLRAGVLLGVLLPGSGEFSCENDVAGSCSCLFRYMLCAVLRTRDVYPGSRVKNIQDPGSGSASKNLSILNPKNVSYFMLLFYRTWNTFLQRFAVNLTGKNIPFNHIDSKVIFVLRRVVKSLLAGPLKTASQYGNWFCAIIVYTFLGVPI
jgi:hypothetical protein